ncbi:MAG: hypothetical protein ABR564_05010 [Candidatus Dormibacteria bacterium]
MKLFQTLRRWSPAATPGLNRRWSPAPTRGLTSATVVLATVLLAACGSSSSSTPAASPSAAGARVPSLGETPGGPGHARGSARWEPTANLSGTGNLTSEPFGIVPDVLQWRVHWHCNTGVLRIRT